MSTPIDFKDALGGVPRSIPTAKPDGMSLLFEYPMTLDDVAARAGVNCWDDSVTVSRLALRVDVAGSAVPVRGDFIMDDASREALAAAVRLHRDIRPWDETTYEQRVLAVCTEDHPERKRIEAEQILKS